MRILFIGHNGYGYPHTRVRCYHFARVLATMPDIETAVLSFRDDLAPHKSEAAMYENLRDREKLLLTGKAVLRLLRERNTLLYIQKAHFHAAAPYWLHRLGWLRHYVLDYDDYDIPLSNFFVRGWWNRIFFGSHRWDEITFRIARGALGCVAASHGLENLLLDHNPRVALIPTGVDGEVFTPPESRPGRDRVIFLWNGLVWGKPIRQNLLLVFRAFQRALPRMENAVLRIIGGGAEWETIQDQTRREFPDVPAEWRDWAEPQQMPDLLRNADVGLLPAEGDDLWLKCKSPTKLFEYMASGLPVVATACGEAVYALRHLESGYLAEDESAFAEGIVRLANDPALRQRLGEGARKQVEAEYTLNVLGEKLYRFLNAITGSLQK
ncbi:MAG TPA: glycosyltransferase family 4 protein [bacterium]|nr:glycosyltransferase family 4 protein [bacterium]HPO99219.1 glycosyltransferase family 4 protein [bacterium]